MHLLLKCNYWYISFSSKEQLLWTFHLNTTQGVLKRIFLIRVVHDCMSYNVRGVLLKISFDRPSLNSLISNQDFVHGLQDKEQKLMNCYIKLNKTTMITWLKEDTATSPSILESDTSSQPNGIVVFACRLSIYFLVTPFLKQYFVIF